MCRWAVTLSTSRSAKVTNGLIASNDELSDSLSYNLNTEQANGHIFTTDCYAPH
ncbi:hypothetical protein BYT27DRAFT_7184288 [Phlegmacium glaucopus]|nr:hypothetical protein BYT27DRAFT_7179695 [Phlegmacium glaucopus]KAF8816362.1 hypothetical protein BYT27DRAFT_7184288 [Phlegmacium glaucopus]